MAELFDIAVIGGGPAGATCATLAARGGRRVVLLERAVFPREKVCGDCLNPLAWRVIEALGLRGSVLALEHETLQGVRFVGIDGTNVEIAFPPGAQPELGISRGVLDALLLQKCRAEGVDVRESETLTALKQGTGGWILVTTGGEVSAKQLVAADGRNSTTARLLGLLPPPVPGERIAMQTHFERPATLAAEVVLQFTEHGYLGLAPIGGGRANLCLVSRAHHMPEMQARAAQAYALSGPQVWRTVTPLGRRPLHPVADKLWLVGDAARVVEPFTGEGIAYALRSGMLCARGLLEDRPADYARDHAQMYRGRLWVNQLARWACLHPRAGSALVHAGRFAPWILSTLTRKIVRR